MLIYFVDYFLFNVGEKVVDFLFWVKVSCGFGGWRDCRDGRFFVCGLFTTLLCFRGHYFICVGVFNLFGLYYKENLKVALEN